MFDIAVIGSGPAGSTLARLLGRRFKVALFEKRDLENARPLPRDGKCCGGLIAPDAQRVLAGLGLGLPRAVAVDPQLFAVRSLDLATGRERTYQRHYLNIDRWFFDRWLRSLVPDRVVAFDACLVSGVGPGPRGRIIRYQRAGREFSAEARLVIGADGARSLVRAACAGGRDNARRYFAVQEWFEFPHSPPYYQAIFDPAITDFYAWTIPKNGSLIVGAALDPARRPLARFALLKQRLEERGLPLSRPFRRESAFLLRPRSGGSIILGAKDSDGLALAGEAAGLVSPSSGEGLSFALESAVRLARAVLDHGAAFARPYAAAMAGLRRKIFFKNVKASLLYRPGLRRLVMASGLGGVKVYQPEPEAAPGRIANAAAPFAP